MLSTRFPIKPWRAAAATMSSAHSAPHCTAEITIGASRARADKSGKMASKKREERTRSRFQSRISEAEACRYFSRANEFSSERRANKSVEAARAALCCGSFSGKSRASRDDAR